MGIEHLRFELLRQPLVEAAEKLAKAGKKKMYEVPARRGIVAVVRTTSWNMRKLGFVYAADNSTPGIATTGSSKRFIPKAFADEHRIPYHIVVDSWDENGKPNI